MRGLAIFLNVVIPGVGSFVVGAIGQGIGQILIWGFGLVLTIGTLGFGAIIGLPMMLGAWIWGIITASGANPQPIQVNITNSPSTPSSPPTIEDDKNKMP